MNGRVTLHSLRVLVPPLPPPSPPPAPAPSPQSVPCCYHIPVPPSWNHENGNPKERDTRMMYLMHDEPSKGIA
ncbi:hypothetical protein HZH66_004283 [Vespula vulgaris]|uniref:Uncharacterized protein n=1 Tax=Vespula vulgaris TaxID=7454 RepID=A0A834NDL6_VESVU|nr:hypothetical protein HZH66_004283 [Vespula vulgaris]